ncbi:MAG TPA: signal peptidase I [Asticcacaulis sp.]|nr:signal peptidase I [Asticcacaulis sp.]
MTTSRDDTPATGKANAAASQAETAQIFSGDDDTAEEEAEPVSTKDAVMNETKEIVSVVAIALLLVMILRTILFQPFTIPSASMEPNLYQGDYIVVSKWNYGISKYSFPVALPFIKGRIFNHAPKRGDIIVFKLPTNPKVDYIKRVIGLPGDRIQMKHDQLFINDQPVPFTNMGEIPAEDSSTGQAMKQHEYLPDGREHFMQDFIKDGNVDDTDVYTVPEHHYFMMGDNRDNSEDSRFPQEVGGVGFVPEENLEGRAMFILLSWKEGSSIWKPWTWLNFHWDRFFKGLK